MTEPSGHDDYGPFPTLEAKRVETAKRLRRNAPRILRWVAALCLARALLIVALAGLWIAVLDPASASRTMVITWAVFGVAFSLLAAGTVALAAAKRMPWGLSIPLALLGMALGIAELLFAMGVLALELAASVPWFLGAVWFTVSIFTVIIVCPLMAWPAILKAVQGREASVARSRGVEPPSGLD
jgi:hypothetical protein